MIICYQKPKKRAKVLLFLHICKKKCEKVHKFLKKARFQLTASSISDFYDVFFALTHALHKQLKKVFFLQKYEFACVCQLFFVILHAKLCEYMKLLLILLSVMSFTVQTKTTVSVEGATPSNMEVEYSNTYQKGDVRKDDVAALMLRELGGIAVEKVVAYVRSNASGGAGNFEVRANGYTVGQKSGTFKDWTGAYDSQNYHAITLVSGSVANVYSLTIQLIGTANSLHIEKFVVTYGDSPAKSVTLMSGATPMDTLREETGGSGVLLPRMENQDRWQFVGWSDIEFEKLDEMPPLYKAYEMFYPEENCTLWAVYFYNDTPDRAYVTDLVDGEYLYVNRAFDISLNGVPDAESGKMAWNITDVHDENQYYTISFASPDTAYITHSKTGNPIGYAGTKMAIKPSPWLVYHQGDETLFYAFINGKNYVLWLNICDGNNENCYAGLLQANPMDSPMALLPSHRRGALRYSCHPERLMGTDLIPSSEGKARKILRNGQVLILLYGETYTIMGTKIND